MKKVCLKNCPYMRIHKKALLADGVSEKTAICTIPARNVGESQHYSEAEYNLIKNDRQYIVLEFNSRKSPLRCPQCISRFRPGNNAKKRTTATDKGSKIPG